MVNNALRYIIRHPIESLLIAIGLLAVTTACTYKYGLALTKKIDVVSERTIDLTKEKSTIDGPGPDPKDLFHENIVTAVDAAKNYINSTNGQIRTEVIIDGQKVQFDVPENTYLKDVADGFLYNPNGPSLRQQRQKQIFKHDPVLDELVKKIIGDSKSDFEKINKIIDFANDNLDYKLDGDTPYLVDVNSEFKEDYQKSPIQTLVDRRTECDGYTALVVGLCNSAGIKAGAVFVSEFTKGKEEGHMVVATPLSLRGLQITKPIRLSNKPSQIIYGLSVPGEHGVWLLYEPQTKLPIKTYVPESCEIHYLILPDRIINY